MNDHDYNPKIAKRFRGFLPVVVDVETAGFNSNRDALLEVAAVIIGMNEDGLYSLPGPMPVTLSPFRVQIWIQRRWPLMALILITRSAWLCQKKGIGKDICAYSRGC